MSKRARTYVIVLLAVLVSVYAVAVAAFAQDDQETVTPQNDGKTSQISLPSSGSSSDSSSSAGSSSSSPGSSGSSGSSRSEESGGTVTVIFNLNGGTGLKSKAEVEKGTKVSELKIPVKKGYQFAGWTSGNAAVSGSMPIQSDIALDAQWEKAAASSGEAPAAGAASVDTKQNDIDAAASAAEQATSEPDALSSQDWGDLLSSEESGAGAVSSEASSAALSSAARSTGGGFSTLLLVGIILIVLGVAGVGTFIYLQFIRKGPGGRGGSGPAGGGKSGDDTIEFTDISSYSDGKKHDSPPGGTRRPAAKSTFEHTRVIGPIDPAYNLIPAQKTGDRRTPESRRDRSERSRILREKSQAKPVEGASSDFNWEKFFKE